MRLVTVTDVRTISSENIFDIHFYARNNGSSTNCDSINPFLLNDRSFIEINGKMFVPKSAEKL